MDDLSRLPEELTTKNMPVPKENSSVHTKAEVDSNTSGNISTCGSRISKKVEHQEVKSKFTGQKTSMKQTSLVKCPKRKFTGQKTSVKQRSRGKCPKRKFTDQKTSVKQTSRVKCPKRQGEDSKNVLSSTDPKIPSMDNGSSLKGQKKSVIGKYI